MKPPVKARRRTNLALTLAFGLASAQPALAQGTISYHQPAEPLQLLFGNQLDLDGNGQVDSRFYDGSYNPPTYSATAASGVGTARLLVTPQGPNDLGSYLVGLNEGFLIGGSMSPAMFWAAHDAPNLYGDATVLGSYLPDEGVNFIPDGYFYGTTAFMGIHFQIGSDWHYGWVRIRGGTAGLSEDGQFYASPPSWILDWAYERRPDTPIFAGAVPEPSTISLLGLAGVLLAWRWRKR